MELQLRSLIHSRAFVPSEYLLCLQKLGELSIWIISIRLGGILLATTLILVERLLCAVFLFAWLLSISTCCEFSYLFFNISPMILKGDNCLQHVWTVHDPDTPWHLHFVSTWFFTTWNKKQNIFQCRLNKEKN